MTSTKNTIVEDGICPTLTARMGTGGNRVNAVMEPVGYEMQAFGKYKNSGCASSLKARDYKDATDLVVSGDPICIDRAFFNQGQNALYEPQCYEDGTVPTLVAKGPAAVSVKHIVRRLTPLECERLQGFPDGWTDIGEWIDSKGKKHKEADSPRYKALGNSIALPPWKWVLKRLCACYERDATMASLFDGIGGFPYIWEQLNGKGSCLWASEIEEFPIAVTKRRFTDGSVF
jgi:DNA (cytosine-5)-methyltransferase 1